VLRDDQAGHDFQNLAGSQSWPDVELFLADNTFGC
jgi:hypothetical protein